MSAGTTYAAAWTLTALLSSGYLEPCFMNKELKHIQQAPKLIFFPLCQSICCHDVIVRTVHALLRIRTYKTELRKVGKKVFSCLLICWNAFMIITQHWCGLSSNIVMSVISFNSYHKTCHRKLHVEDEETNLKGQGIYPRSLAGCGRGRI